MSPRNSRQNEQMRQESLKKIADAGLRVFAEFGYHGATLKKITKATGLSYGLVYHYFPSKADIFFYLVDIAFTNSKKIMDRVFDSSLSAVDKIKSLAAILVNEEFSEKLSLHFLITQQAMIQVTDIPGLDEFIMNRTDHYKRFDLIVKEGQGEGGIVDGDPEILSSAFMALVQGLALLMLHDNNLRERITPEILTNLLLKNE